MTEAQIAEYIAPYIVGVVGFLLALVIKDAAVDFAKGMAFKLGPDFNEGDQVIIDGEKAIIVKIGFRNTVFGIVKENDDYVWRYVQNTYIPRVKLEKVVRPKVINDR